MKKQIIVPSSVLDKIKNSNEIIVSLRKKAKCFRTSRIDEQSRGRSVQKNRSCLKLIALLFSSFCEIVMTAGVSPFFLIPLMINVPLICPLCGSDHVRKNGTASGKQRYLCKNDQCSHQTFYAEYTYNAYEPGIKTSILRWSIDGTGVRAISRQLGVNQNTIIAELKKRNDLSHVNEDYFKRRKHCKIHVEKDLYRFRFDFALYFCSDNFYNE